MRLFREKMHLKTAFSYKIIERSYSNPVVREILDEVLVMIQISLFPNSNTFISKPKRTTCIPQHLK